MRVTRADMASMMVSDCRDAASGKLERPKLIFASNGSVIARYHSDASFRYLFSQADVIDADGTPLVFASRFFCSTPLAERVATTDLIHDCAATAAREGIKFYFLGGRSGVAESAAARLRGAHPDLQIVGCRDGYFDPADEHLIWRDIRETGAQVLWLGLGSPLQERLARSWQPHLPGVAWIRTCGGLFDHVAGRVPRAPKWVQDAGFEWLHRLCLEPRRLGPRYLYSNPVAAFHLLTKTHDHGLSSGRKP